MRTDRRALIVGIEEYTVLNKLNYAKNDALAINEALSEYNFQFGCELLTNEEATVAAVRNQFRNLFSDADDDAIIIFFFAGHGVYIDGSTFLVTLDKEDSIEDSLDLRRLIDIVTKYRKASQSCIFILDCCHSGALGLENMTVSLDAIQDAIVYSSTSITLIASAEASKIAKESDEYRQGVFSHFLFDGLLGAAANNQGEITVSTLGEYVSKCMSEFHPDQKIVLKTTYVGQSPILGAGFTPRHQIEIAKLGEAQLQDITSKTVDRLKVIKRNLEYTHEKIWIDKLHNETSRLLTELIQWRQGLENKYVELKTSKAIRVYDHDILRTQIELANITTGIVLQDGIVEREIGMGGFGTVYEIDSIRGRREAYKVYHSNQMHDKDKLKAFKRGYNAMKKLDHPNIVKVIKFTDAPIGFYMDYIEGSNFRDWWTDDVTKILNLLHVIAQTVENAHENDVVHRDIKPENIIVASNPHNETAPIPYLTDFDLAWYSMATMYSDIESKTAVVGHYLYAAPEQYETPQADITKKPTADIYGFGQLCYFAVCNRDPERDGDQAKATLKARLEGWTSGEAAYLFMEMYGKATRRTPSQRYQKMREVSADILKIRNLIVDPDKNRILTTEEFIAELIFSIFGFQVSPSRAFVSISQRTQIHIQSITKTRIDLKFELIQGYAAMTGTFEQQRNALNRRVDKVLDDLSNLETKRHSEKVTDVYSTRIDVEGNFLNLEGVAKIRQVIEGVISCLEN
ncbi:MAG: protein kinase [Anaerolineaceae bacterium]|nr:protein kinase [Anaerolineaceae bacterium]